MAIKTEKKALEENIYILQSGFLSNRSATDCLLMLNRVRKKVIENNVLIISTVVKKTGIIMAKKKYWLD